jgi:hypothetical protein
MACSAAARVLEWVSVAPSSNAELDAAHRELADLYRELAVPRPFSWSRMSTQRKIARVKRRIAQLEQENRPDGT